jgi:hypothetical protein
MPRVSAGRRVAVGERPCHGGIADVPAPSAVPDRLEFPFQFSAGSQTSILMSESGLGVSVAPTRQKAGRVLKMFGV